MNNDNRKWTAAEWQAWRKHIAEQDARIHELRARHKTPAAYRII